MKKTNIILIFVLYLLVSCASSTEEISLGLVAFYPLDGNAQDISGGNNHLKVDGVVLTTDRFGNENSAYSFDGSASSLFAEVTNMPAMDSAKTISWWYISDEMPQYDRELGAENMLVLVDSTAGMGIQFGFRAPGYKTKGFDTWEWGGGTFMDMDYPGYGLWHHCVYTYDGTTHIFYLDGEKIATSIVEPKGGIPNQLMLGNYPGGDQFYRGSLDEIRIYNRVLTLSEVNTLSSCKIGAEEKIATSISNVELKEPKIDYPFVDDFENGDITPWFPESLPKDWSTTYVETPGGRKGFCRRAEIRKEVTILGRPRAEYTIQGSAWAKDHAERWFGVGIFVPNDFEPGTADKFVNMFHLHGTPDFDLGEDWRHGLHHLGVYKNPDTNQLIWSYNYNSMCAAVGVNDDVIHSENYDLGEVKKGVWNDFVIYIKFAYCEDQDGQLKLWMNSDIDDKIPTLETFGPNCYNDQQGPYVKMGMQNWNFAKMPEWTTPLVIYYDNWRMDDENGTLSSVDPGTRH